MNFPPFKLERWFTNNCRWNLSGAGPVKLALGDIGFNFPSELRLGHGSTKGDEVCRELLRLHLNVDPANDILITSGTAEANALAVLSSLVPGDELVYFTPSYMQCAGIAEAIGAEAVKCELDACNSFRLDIDKLANCISRRTKMICITNPNNPTGTCFSEEELLKICNLASSVGAYVLIDEALRGLVFEGLPITNQLLQYPRILRTGSLSKVGLSGVRIGWLCGPSDKVSESWKLKDYLTLTHSVLGEYMLQQLLHREMLDELLARSRAVGFSGFCYLRDVTASVTEFQYVNPVAGHSLLLFLHPEHDSIAFANSLLNETGVLVSPGEFFGYPKGIRLRFGGEREVLVNGLARVVDVLKYDRL